MRKTITLATALALVGCMKPNPLAEDTPMFTSGEHEPSAGETAADGETGSEDSGGPEQEPPGDGDGEPGDGDGDGDGDGEPGDGDGDGDGEPGDGDGESGSEEPGDGDGDGDGEPEEDPIPPPDLAGDQEPFCALVGGFETECAACLVDNCCQVIEVCLGAQNCECLAACALAGESPGQCKVQCGAEPGDVPELAPLLDCAAASCVSDC